MSGKEDGDKAVMVPFSQLMRQLKQIVARTVTFEFLRREKGFRPLIDVPGASMALATDMLIYATISVLQTF